MKLIAVQNQVLSGPETARMLGISVSSVRNWVRHGFICTTPGAGDFIFLREEVVDLKERIERGEVSRLNSRANKLKSSRTFLPVELFENACTRGTVSDISAYIRLSSIDVDTAMFMLSLNLLKRKDLLKRHNPEDIISSPSLTIRGRKHLTRTLRSWMEALPHTFDQKTMKLLEFELPDQNNVLGIIYQSILQEGEKSSKGSYYTPHGVVENIVQRLAEPGVSFLDPCCGTGQFLVSFAEKSGDPEKIFGIDIDSVAVNIAKINMIVHFPDLDFEPPVYCSDSLLNYNDSQLFDSLSSLPGFDVIATNPPWGFHYESDEKKNLRYFYPDINSGESFSYFFVKSMAMLKEGGKLAFVLPESVLNVKMHRDIRKYILDETRILRIEYGKKIFKNVFTSAVIIDVQKSAVRDDVKIVRGVENYHIRQERFSSNRDMVFDIHLSGRDEKIIDGVYSKNHCTLKSNAAWALGIVTGNNSAFINEEECGAGQESIIKGRDLMPYSVKSVSSFISFEPERFQQMAPEKMYRAEEKLIYKYISNRPVFYCDRSRMLTLNSANIVIPSFDDIPMNFIAALFNSVLYQFIFQKKFSSIKVLRSHLEQLPIPLIGRQKMNDIGKQAELLFSARGDDYDRGVDLINETVFEIFELSQEEIDYICSSCRK